MYWDIHSHKAFGETESVLRIHSLTPSEFRESKTSEFISIGLHPWHLEKFDEQLDQLKQILNSTTSILAIGECGLDRIKSKYSLETQTNVFLEQIELGEAFNLPLILHSVKTNSDLLHIMKEKKPHSPWIIHGYRGNATECAKLLRAGFYLSFGEHFNPESLTLAYKNSRLLTETDTGEVSIETIYKNISRSLNIDLQELEQSVDKTARNIFGARLSLTLSC